MNLALSPSLRPSAADAPLSAPALRCRLITTLAEWRTLEPVWDALLAASADQTPWQSFTFLTRWWEHLAQGMPLRVFVVERDGAPCLVLPLQIAQWRDIPGLSVRLLEPVGMVMDVNRPRLALGAFDPDAYHCAFAAIWERKDEWDAIRVDEKPWEDAEIALLRDYALERQCIFRQLFSHLVPFLDLRQPWESYLKTRSSRMRKNLRAARRKLEEMGRVELRHYETPDEVRTGFQVMLQLHTRSWKRLYQVEHSKSPGYQAFYSGWIETMARRDAVRMLALFCNDRPVAATIAFTDRGIYYSAQIVHDSHYAPCSPGTLLEALELEKLMREQRYRTYDFLGSFLSNKMRWTDTATRTAMTLVLQRRLRTFLMDGYFTFFKPYVRPALLSFYDKLKARLTMPRKKAPAKA